MAIYKYDGPVTRPAKLVVVLAGLFNNAKDPLPIHVLRMMKALGYHVLVIPNSFSTTYMNQGPQFAIADFVQEAEVVREVTASVIQSQIGKQNVLDVEILGESYGAFLVPVVLAQDTSHIFGNTAVALSPPVNILQSMGRLDNMINATASQRALCVDSDFVVVEAGEQAVAQFQAEISGTVARCAPAFLSYVVFQESLVQSAMRMNGNIYRQLSPNQVHSLTFNSFFSIFEPGILQSRGPQFMSFESWLLLAEKNNPNLRMKIVSAQDDFLNSSRQWSAATFNDPSHVQLIALSWGGHLGYLTDPWFENGFYNLLN